MGELSHVSHLTVRICLGLATLIHFWGDFTTKPARTAFALAFSFPLLCLQTGLATLIHWGGALQQSRSELRSLSLFSFHFSLQASLRLP